MRWKCTSLMLQMLKICKYCLIRCTNNLIVIFITRNVIVMFFIFCFFLGFCWSMWDGLLICASLSKSASYLILYLVASGQRVGVVLGMHFPVAIYAVLCGLPQSSQKLVVLHGLPNMPANSLTALIDTGQADHRRPLVTLTTVPPCLYSSSFYSTWLALRRYVPLPLIWDTPLFPLSHIHPAFCLNVFTSFLK